MPDEMVLGIRITGNSAGVTRAVNSAISEFNRLDARLKTVAKAAGSSNLFSASKNPTLSDAANMGTSKEISAWQEREELNLARQRMMYVKQQYDAATKAASQYYAKIQAQEAKIAAIRQKLATAQASGGSTARLSNSLGKQEQVLFDMRVKYAKQYESKVIAAEKKVFDATINFARKITQTRKKELANQERDAKRAADEQIRQQKRIASEQQRVARDLRAGMSQAMNSGISALGSMGNSFRLITQGFSELGRVLTTFIAIPLGGIFAMSTRTAIDFEAAIVRVGKTTGLEGEKLQKLTQWIRDFSKSTVSSHVELATFAEQLGQLGVVDTNAMSRLIANVEMMASATDLSADEVTKAIGRIATAFGYDLNTESGVRAVEKLSNAINLLENTTAASAGEIIEGLLNVASVGGMLDIPVQDMAAVVAMMESMGVASDAVGNRISRFYQQLITKSSDAAKFMKGFSTEIIKDGEAIKRTYSGDEDEFMAWLNEDKTQVLTDFMSALNQVPDASKAQAMAQWFELVGQVGGKVGVMAGNVQGLGTALANARKEFESGNSLFREYDKALMTTDAHIKILRNNLNDAAITVGDAFLPVLNRLIEYAVPGIQMLASAFKSLTWETKLLVVGIPLVAMVLAPLLFIFSQLFHGVGMVAMSFQALLVAAKNFGAAIMGVGKAVGALVGGVRLLATGGGLAAGALGGSLAPALATVAAALLGVVAVGGLAYAALKSLQGAGVDIAGFFNGLANRARAWGENLMYTYAGGLLSGAANYVAQAIARIAEWIAGFFESHSPPKKGPLSDIDKWGGPLFTSFLRGFYLADFSILEDVGNTVRNILQKMFSGEDSDSAIDGMVGAAREALAQLIDLFNKTGQISQDLLDKIAAGTGHLAEDLKKLVTLWLEYEKTQRRIKELEQERQKAEKGYEDEVATIAASNLSAEEKAARIREAMSKRNRAIDAIEKEKAAEEEKADALKEQLEWQKAFLKAQLDQASIFDKMAKSLDKLGGALGGLGEALNFGKGGLGGGPDPVKPFEELTTTIKDRLDKAKLVVRTFLDGLRGDFSEIWLDVIDPDLAGELQKAYDLGKKLYDVFHPQRQAGGDGKEVPFLAAVEAAVKGVSKAISEAWNTVVEVVANNEDVKAALNTLGELAELLFSPKAAQDLEGAKKGWEQFGYGFGLVIGVLIKLLGALVIAVAWILNLPEHLRELNDTIKEVGKGIGQAAEDIGRFFGEELGPKIAEFFGNLAKEAVQWGEDLVKEYGNGIVGSIGKFLADAASKAAQGIADFFEPNSPPKKGPLSTIDTWGGKLLSLLIDGFLSGDFNPLAKVADRVKEALSGIFGGDKGGGGGIAKTILDVIVGIFTDMIAVFTEKIPVLAGLWQQIKNQPQTILGDLGAVVILPIFMTVFLLLSTWFATYTPLLLQQWILFRDTFVTAFEALPGMVALVFSSLFFQPAVVEALGIAYEEFEKAGRNFAGFVGKGINSMAADVIGEMSNIIDGLISQIERALDAVNALMSALDELNNASVNTPTGGNGGGGGGGSGNNGSSGSTGNKGNKGTGGATPMASGGIAVRPTFAMIAEAGESEAVIPLSRLPELVGRMMPTPENTYLKIEINNPQVRSDDDIRKIVREVKRSMVSELRDQNRMKGRS